VISEDSVVETACRTSKVDLGVKPYAAVVDEGDVAFSGVPVGASVEFIRNL